MKKKEEKDAGVEMKLKEMEQGMGGEMRKAVREEMRKAAKAWREEREESKNVLGKY